MSTLSIVYTSPYRGLWDPFFPLKGFVGSLILVPRMRLKSCEMAGFLAFARQRVFPGGGPSDVFGALHAEGNYSSGHCSGFPPDSLSTQPLILFFGGGERVGITICGAKL